MPSEITKCDGCGLESERKDIFQIVRRSFRKKTQTLCPVCFGKKDEKIHIFFFWHYAVLLLAALIFQAFFPTLSFGPWLLNIAMLQLFVFVCTVLHELGHAWAGLMVGFRIFKIEIGHGRVVSEFRTGKVRWQFRNVPFGGCVHGAPRRAGSYKLRESIFILGGPLANLAIIAVCYLTWPGGVAIDTGAFQGSDPALMLILSNGLLLFSSLWPRRYESRQGKAPNDILLLWETARYSRKQVEQMPAHWYFLEGEESREQGRYTEANEWIAKGLKLFPNNYFLEWLQASNLMDLQSYTDARKAYVRLLGRYSKSEELRFTAFNNIAYTNVLSGDAELLEEAEICSRVAVEKYPFNFYFVGTRGSVLIELREYESGLKLLHQALKQHTERDARALNACYIAIGEARLGNVNESRHFFAMARKLDPNCLLLERESHELGS